MRWLSSVLGAEAAELIPFDLEDTHWALRDIETEAIVAIGNYGELQELIS